MLTCNIAKLNFEAKETFVGLSKTMLQLYEKYCVVFKTKFINPFHNISRDKQKHFLLLIS